MSDHRGKGRTVYMPERMRRQLNVASACAGMSSHAYILCAVAAALATHAENEPALAMVFEGQDKLAMLDDR